MRVVSWNVNGLRAADRGRGFRRFLDSSKADIVGVQEVRATLEQLPRRLVSPKGWHFTLVSAQRKGYSGVGLYTRRRPDQVITSLDHEEIDSEGRVQIAVIGDLVVANAYFPNGNGQNRDNSRVPFKLDFYRRLFAALGRWRAAGKKVLVMGDFNTAHREVDLARPKQNHKTSGFLPEEREVFDELINDGWIDTFRVFQPEAGHYSWWSQRQGVREKNIGWRIDYVLGCEQIGTRLLNAFIWPKVRGSDHCPVGVDLALNAPLVTPK